jgi:hypothetical protein
MNNPYFLQAQGISKTFDEKAANLTIIKALNFDLKHGNMWFNFLGKSPYERRKHRKPHQSTLLLVQQGCGVHGLS